MERTGAMTIERVESIGEFRNWLNQTVGRGGGYAFRGQEDAKWPLACGATRRLRSACVGSSYQDESFRERFLQYHRETLIRPARSYGFGLEGGRELGDLEILAKLQHLGAATGLLDFTRNTLIALWFACQLTMDGNPEPDGRVFVLDTAERRHFRELTPSDAQEKDNLINLVVNPEQDVRDKMSWYWEPPVVQDVAPRILRQHSLFVFGHIDFPVETCQSVIIAGSGKKEILDELAANHDLSAESLFRDVYGFAGVANKHTAKLRPIKIFGDYIDRGTEAFNQENFNAAVNYFSEAVYLRPKSAEVFFDRGRSKASLGQSTNDFLRFQDAIEDYDAAIFNIRRQVWEEIWLVRPAILYARGNARAILNRLDEAVLDYTECVQCKITGNPINALVIAQAYFNCGNVLFTLGHWERASDSFQAAISHSTGLPNNFILHNTSLHNTSLRNSHFNLGNTFVKTENYQSAIKHYGLALEFDASYVPAAANKAAARVLVKDLETVDRESGKSNYNVDHAANMTLVKDALAGCRVEGNLRFAGNVGNSGDISVSTPRLKPGSGSGGDFGFSIPFCWPIE